MEVHAHTHTARKKWTHYFWEFFMLFLAVTAGFLVENKREHYIEHQRGKQYVKSFVEDLRFDTARFTDVINYYRYLDRKLTPLPSCFEQILRKQDVTDCLQNILLATDGFADLIYTDRTLQQLKNAGGLRLLEKEDADSIIRYDSHLRRVLAVESTGMQEKSNQVRNTRNDVLAYSEILDTTHGTKKKAVKLEIVTNNKELLNRFFNEVLFYRNSCRYMAMLITGLRERAAGLLVFFTEKYHWK